jgi:hypothetical protein
MKTLKFLSVLFLLFSAILISSCENEPIDSALLDSIDNGGGGVDGGGGTDGGGSTGGGTGGGTTSTTYNLKVTKDGVAKQWTTVEAINSTVLNTFLIVASDGSSSMNLTLFGVSSTGAYPLSFATISCIYTEGFDKVYGSDYSDFSTSSGNITITELNKTNKTIKGIFSFNGKNTDLTETKIFTKGEFFVKYAVQ